MYLDWSHWSETSPLEQTNSCARGVSRPFVPLPVSLLMSVHGRWKDKDRLIPTKYVGEGEVIENLLVCLEREFLQTMKLGFDQDVVECHDSFERSRCIRAVRVSTTMNACGSRRALYCLITIPWGLLIWPSIRRLNALVEIWDSWFH